MILQALHDLYQRLRDDGAPGLPKPGYSLQNITFRVVIRPDGSLVEIQDARSEKVMVDKKGKERRTRRPTPLLVPGQAKATGQGLNPGFLWDNTIYLLGYKPENLNGARTRASHDAFKRRHEELEPKINDPEFSAVCRFLESWNPEAATSHPLLDDISNGFGIFQIAGNRHHVHESKGVIEWQDLQLSAPAGETGFCLVTGREALLAQLHDPPIKGVANAQSSGAKLVSFNLPSFNSYAKEQSFNSPVSQDAAFAYCCALNHLLRDNRRRFRIGDATTVFWTERPTAAEVLLPCMMDLTRAPEDEGVKQRLADVFGKLGRGQLSEDDLGDADTRFYILGLAPNASRLSVRFWHTATLGELARNLQKHFNHLRIVRKWDETNSSNPEPLVPSVFQLLRQTARDADAIAPLLGGALMRSILLGTRYPDPLTNGVMSRIRVVEKDQQGRALDNVTYLRASILKAWLIRNHQQEIKPMLDETNTMPAYRLGRLFAALEKTQQDALPGINSTIRERFYSSASATPRAVFGRLLRTYQHHLAKLQGGRKTNREKLVQDICWPLDGKAFPAHFNLSDQSLFAIGYYHQRKAFFPAKQIEPAINQAA